MKDKDKFSERERAIIKIIGRKKLTIEQVTNELFLKSWKFEGRIVVGNSIRRIIKKCEHHKLSWTLEKIRDNTILTIRRIKL